MNKSKTEDDTLLRLKKPPFEKSKNSGSKNMKLSKQVKLTNFFAKYGWSSEEYSKELEYKKSL